MLFFWLVSCSQITAEVSLPSFLGVRYSREVHRSFSLQGWLVFRRYESVIARFYNLGADVVSLFGYLKTKWGAEMLVDLFVVAGAWTRISNQY